MEQDRQRCMEIGQCVGALQPLGGTSQLDVHGDRARLQDSTSRQAGQLVDLVQSEEANHHDGRHSNYAQHDCKGAHSRIEEEHRQQGKPGACPIDQPGHLPR